MCISYIISTKRTVEICCYAEVRLEVGESPIVLQDLVLGWFLKPVWAGKTDCTYWNILVSVIIKARPFEVILLWIIEQKGSADYRAWVCQSFSRWARGNVACPGWYAHSLASWFNALFRNPKKDCFHLRLAGVPSTRRLWPSLSSMFWICGSLSDCQQVLTAAHLKNYPASAQNVTASLSWVPYCFSRFHATTNIRCTLQYILDQRKCLRNLIYNWG